MAIQDPGLDVGYLQATGDLSAKQFLAVKVDASNSLQVILASTGGEAILGILQNKPTTGQAADIRVAGVSKAVIGSGGVTAGDLLMTATSGALITATNTNYGVAIALETGSSGDTRAVLVLPSGKTH